eukprot:9475868-Pyramimonas_sp.AAC.1
MTPAVRILNVPEYGPKRGPSGSQTGLQNLRARARASRHFRGALLGPSQSLRGALGSPVGFPSPSKRIENGAGGARRRAEERLF